MIDRMLFPSTLAAALGAALIAGVFFAFSSFVMKALAQVPPPAGIASMQSINVVVVRSWFMVPFMGTAALCALLLVAAFLKWDRPGSGWLAAGCALYLAGTFLSTIVFNVPLNDALAAVDPNGPDGAALWARYLVDWSLWNHVRTAAALAATASFIMAIRVAD